MNSYALTHTPVVVESLVILYNSVHCNWFIYASMVAPLMKLLYVSTIEFNTCNSGVEAYEKWGGHEWSLLCCTHKHSQMQTK